MKELLENPKINALVIDIAKMFENKGLLPLQGMLGCIRENPTSNLIKQCSSLYLCVKDLLEQEGFLEKLIEYKKEIPWVGIALVSGDMQNGYDLDKVAIYLCAGLVEEHCKDVDDYIESINDTSLCQELDIPTNEDCMVNLSSKHLHLENQGLIYKDSVLLYPHQFLRRRYAGNFVGMPALLRKAYESGLETSIRLDPFRKTSSKYYQETIEADRWHGPPFGNALLLNTELKARTVHRSTGYYSLTYDPRFTVFRTNMKENFIRQFMVEEYCNPHLFYTNKAPGVGDRYCIQKFAHFYYNQDKKCFTHLDGAIRVFEIEEYKQYLDVIQSGSDVDSKIGERYKMFLVEGEFNEELARNLITEWFRYNPHIQEYFSNTTAIPLAPYE